MAPWTMNLPDQLRLFIPSIQYFECPYYLFSRGVGDASVVSDAAFFHLWNARDNRKDDHMVWHSSGGIFHRVMVRSMLQGCNDGALMLLVATQLPHRWGLPKQAGWRRFKFRACSRRSKCRASNDSSCPLPTFLTSTISVSKQSSLIKTSLASILDRQ